MAKTYDSALYLSDVLPSMIEAPTRCNSREVHAADVATPAVAAVGRVNEVRGSAPAACPPAPGSRCPSQLHHLHENMVGQYLRRKQVAAGCPLPRRAVDSAGDCRAVERALAASEEAQPPLLRCFVCSASQVIATTPRWATPAEEGRRTPQWRRCRTSSSAPEVGSPYAAAPSLDR